MPLLFGALTLYYTVHPETFRPIVDRIPLAHFTETLEDSTAYPGTIPQAFALGKIVATVQDVNERLVRVRELLGTPLMSEKSLRILVEELEKGEENGLFQKALGFITFVNIMWLIAILGLASSVGPFLAIWLGPTIGSILRRIADEVFKICKWLFLATSGIHDVVWTLASFLILLANERFRAGTREYIALTACLLLAAGYYIFVFFVAADHPSLRRRDNMESDFKASFRKWQTVADFGGIVAAGSLALVFDSDIFGSLAVAVFYHMLGFGVWSEPLVVYIGFQNDQALAKSTIASSLILVLTITMRALKISSFVTRPFNFALQTMGASCYYLGLLIGQHSRSVRNRPGLVRGFLLGSIVLGLFTGSVLGIPAIFNSSVVFVVLEILDFIAMCRLWNDPAKVWAMIFIGSAVVFRLSIWMKTNPDWVSKVFMT